MFLAHPDACLGFQVEDKNGDEYYYCGVTKELTPENGKFYNDNGELVALKSNPLVDVVMSLNRGDKIRLVGKKGPYLDSMFSIEKIEMIESAADAAVVKKVKEDLGN